MTLKCYSRGGGGGQYRTHPHSNTKMIAGYRQGRISVATAWLWKQNHQALFLTYVLWERCQQGRTLLWLRFIWFFPLFIFLFFLKFFFFSLLWRIKPSTTTLQNQIGTWLGRTMGKIRSGTHSNTTQLEEVKMDWPHRKETSGQCTRQALKWNPQGKRKRGHPVNTWQWDVYYH